MPAGNEPNIPNSTPLLETLYRSPIIRVAVAVAAITLGASLVLGGCERAYVEGDHISFSGTDIDGQPVSLADARFKNKVVLVELWGLWCPVCLSSLPALKDLQTRYAAQGFEVLAVEFADETPSAEYLATLREMVRANDIAFTIAQAGVVGSEAAAFPELKSFDGYPTIILIDRGGAVKYIQSGYHPRDAEILARKIEELLREGAD